MSAAAWHLPSAPYEGSRKAGSPARVCELLVMTAREIGTIPVSLEEKFLETGRRLAAFQSISRRMAAAFGEAAVETGEDRLLLLLDELGSLLTGVRSREESRERENRDGKGALKEIRDLVAAAEHDLARLRKSTETLSSLRLCAKIQSAGNLGRAGLFRDISGEIGRVVRFMNERTAVIRSSLEGFAREVEATEQVLEKGATRERSLLDGSLHLLDESRRQLAELRRRGSASLSRIGDKFTAVARSVGEIVVALQYHDITRQKIEHAALALTECAAAPPGPVSAVPALVPDFLPVCEVQAAQLRAAHREIGDSLRNVAIRLGEIASESRLIQDECRELFGARSTSGESCIAEITKEISAAMDSFREEESIRTELDRRIRTTVDAVDQAGRFIADMEDLGEEVKVLALNAIIRSAQVGEAGVGIGVIAEAIRAESAVLSRAIAAVGEVLRSIDASVTSFRNRVAEGELRGEEDLYRTVAELLAALRETEARVGTRMRTLEESVADLLAQVGEAGAALACTEELRTLDIKGIRVLQEITGFAWSAADGEEAGLAAVRSRYTMTAERVTHDRVLGDLTAVAGGDGTAGDDGNVTLF